MEISVVMCSYNAERFIKEAIDSILNQTLRDFEFIIIDDGSTDRTLDIIKSYTDKRIVLIVQENLGVAKAANNGILAARGKYIARMDADDICNSTRLECQLEFMHAHPECIALGSSAHIMDIGGNFLYTHKVFTEWSDIKKIFPESPIYNSSSIFRKDDWEKAGRYPEEILHFFEDKILWNKMAQLGQIRNLPEALISYRLSPGSITNNSYKSVLKLRSICNRYLESGNWSEENLAELEKVSSIIKRSNERRFYYHLKVGHIYLNENRNTAKALQNFSKCVLFQPLNFRGWIGILYCIVPKPIFVFMKKIKNHKTRL